MNLWSVGFCKSESNRLNNFATSSADLGTGLTNSASAMATAGDDIQHTLAMLTGGAEINNIVSIYSNVYALCA